MQAKTKHTPVEKVDEGINTLRMQSLDEHKAS